MSDVPNRQSHLIRWAVIVTMGRVVVEAETADAAREKAERRGYFVLEVNSDASSQMVSFDSGMGCGPVGFDLTTT